MLRQIDQVACSAENGAGALGDLDPDAGEDRRAWTPFEQFNAEKFLKLADLHRQGGLTDGAFLCCASEVLASGERVEISKLPYRQHDLSLALVLLQRKQIAHIARHTHSRRHDDAMQQTTSAGSGKLTARKLERLRRQRAIAKAAARAKSRRRQARRR